jgi:two-component system, sensor histidine kinase and response regulator
MTATPIQILVVDDDPLVREMLQEILTASGYRAETAEDGRAALDRMDAGEPADLILSDMNMPRVDGLSLIRTLRDRKEDVPVIILTGNEEISVALEALNSGANDYLLKDENIGETVLLSVQKVLEKERLERENQRLLNDLAQKNEDLAGSNRELIELNQLKNKFLTMAAHDLRNPIIAIRELTEILTDPDDARLELTERRQYLGIIHETSHEMLSLLNDLLDVSIIESGRLEIRPEPVDLPALIADRVRINQVVAEKKGIRIETDLPEIPPLELDSSRIVQVFDNLMSNAIKFSPKGSRIRVGMTAGAETVRVAVTDEGPGIADDEIDRLFGELERLSARPTAGEHSTGLGLAIVKKVVEAHGGTVGVISREGHGSTFYFDLPRQSPPAAG